MSDKLEALSQPVGFISKCAAEMLEDGETSSIRPYFDVQGSKPLYSQEYVTALLAALERSTKNEHALGGLLDEMTRRRDSQANRANAAEQREEHLKATVDVLSAKNAEIEQQLSRTNSMLSESIAALKAAEEQIEQLKGAK
ncbi:hypothetical protein [Serratia fonticola]|uniref:hypothetical protein n=1 Tax=Serratia fonticola TaxID=47917 RepID=UPI003AAEB1A2